MQLPIKLLEWETAFFGKKTALLVLGGALPEKSMLEEYCRKENIELLQACVDISDSANIFALETLGFHFADLRLFVAGDVNKNTQSKKDPHIRVSVESDIPKLLAVTHHSFTENSRYNWQNVFTTAQIDNFYDVWLENGVRGKHDDFCFHYEVDGKIAGLTTIKVKGNSAYIGIITVNATFSGRGIGDALVENVFNYAKERGLATVSSATQGKNTITQNLFTKHGMRFREIQSWYYKKI